MKIRNFILMGLASLMMASSVQANFFSWKRDNERDEKRDEKNEWQNGLKNIIKNFRVPQRPEPKKQSVSKIWEHLCGNKEGNWNFERTRDADEFGDIMKKLRKICGDRPEIEEFCKKIIRENNVYHNGERYCPKPPSSAVPEPSTYGMIGAGALLGLVAMRRFKGKTVKK